MAGVPDDPNAVLQTAIANEIEGHKILQQGKEAARDPLARATYEFLANEELKHIELIKDFAKSLSAGENWDPAKIEEITLSDAAKEIRGIFERFRTQFEETATAADERLEVYQVAMDMEHRGYDFYSAAAEKSRDERARALFEYLSREEQRHFQMIQDTHDFLAQPDAVFAMEERWMQT